MGEIHLKIPLELNLSASGPTGGGALENTSTFEGRSGAVWSNGSPSTMATTRNPELLGSEMVRENHTSRDRITQDTKNRLNVHLEDDYLACM
jgi:hypothetical protein